jgi:hypothetical protein
MNAPFVTDPQRTAIALAYRNEDMIADIVLPRAPVSQEEFKWTEYDKADRFTVPDTTIDRKGQFNQVEFGGTEKSSMTSDYGLSDVIPQKDIDAAANVNFDPLGNATELLAELIMLDREIRVAEATFTAAAHQVGNKETLSGTDQWDNAAAKPLEQLADAMEVPFMTPNWLVVSSLGALNLRRNASVVKAYNGTTGDEGLVPLSWIAQTLGLQGIIVAKAKLNVAKPGQTASYGRVWKHHALLFYRNASAMPNRGLTYGLTAQFGQRVAQTRRDDSVGLRGATEVRVGESVKELILAKDCAYFFENTLANA